MVVLFGAALAAAEVITLDNGVALQGVLAQYDRAGTCVVDVREGDLAGTAVAVPCGRVVRVERGQDAVAEAPAPAPPAPAEVEAVHFGEAPVVEVPLAIPREEPQDAPPDQEVDGLVAVPDEEGTASVADAPPPAPVGPTPHRVDRDDFWSSLHRALRPPDSP